MEYPSKRRTIIIKMGLFEYMTSPRPVITRRTAEELLGPLSNRDRKNAPEELFVGGDIRLLKDTIRVSVVGTRNPSPQGIKRAEKVSQLLIDAGVVVTSGLAGGIDRAAHEMAIACRGRTIGVVGTPLDKVYPASNRRLQETMTDTQAVVSQFPPGSLVERQNFTQRNLTMALLVKAGVIVEASEDVGVIAHGWELLRLGRPLFLLESLYQKADVTWPKKMEQCGAQVLSGGTVNYFLEVVTKV